MFDEYIQLALANLRNQLKLLDNAIRALESVPFDAGAHSSSASQSEPRKEGGSERLSRYRNATRMGRRVEMGSFSRGLNFFVPTISPLKLRCRLLNCLPRGQAPTRAKAPPPFMGYRLR